MTEQIYGEALPWILWALGFVIVYILASKIDDDKLDASVKCE